MEEIKINPINKCKIVNDYNEKEECFLCGQYENPTNDEESRLDNPENPEYFIEHEWSGNMVHDSCAENR